MTDACLEYLISYYWVVYEFQELTIIRFLIYKSINYLNDLHIGLFNILCYIMLFIKCFYEYNILCNYINIYINGNFEGTIDVPSVKTIRLSCSCSQ